MGVDVGSTTVKVVVIDGDTDTILWADYQRHETKQPEKALEMLKAITADFPNTPQENFRAFITGSGGSGIAKHIGAKFVQEVNAVSLAVEKLYPHAARSSNSAARTPRSSSSRKTRRPAKRRSSPP
jgi:activator of 2-hydroxyglutaryl-CoA dehydratase